MAGSMTGNGALTWAIAGAAWRRPQRDMTHAAHAKTSGMLQGPWVSGGSWGGRPAERVARRAHAMPVRQTVRAHRPRAGRRFGWRRMMALTGDVLMVLTWAAMIPGILW